MHCPFKISCRDQTLKYQYSIKATKGAEFQRNWENSAGGSEDGVKYIYSTHIDYNGSCKCTSESGIWPLQREELERAGMGEEQLSEWTEERITITYRVKARVSFKLF